MTQDANDFWGAPIYSYSRAQAIADGVLVDVSGQAAEDGFKFPVAMTAAAFAQIVPGSDARPGQDLRGRLHDVFTMLLLKIRSVGDASEIRFGVILADATTWTLELKAMVGSGDNGEGIITILLPHED